ncbi:substrate-binding domain-containing protein [Candidatus Caldatribacterium saccharofermentans]|uniref:substrate-binding domain-containing protein n=1 Tax=Candidatus Caldatribacterium saccharofermentans TaxID=1454753 RepID=UPI003D05CB48
MRKFVLGFVVGMFLVCSVLGSLALSKDLTIGLSFPSLSFAWFAFLEQAVKDKAAQLGGIEVVSLEAENNVSKQISIIEDMIIRGVNGVLLVPIEVEAVIPAIEALNKANIPVVTVDRRIKEGAPVQILCHVGADNVEGGRKAAKFIVEKLIAKYGEPKGVVIELTGTPGAGPAIDRSAGFNEIMEQYPNIVVKSQTANFRREDGMKVMEDFIMSTPQIDAVFGANDEMILGAIQALDASGKFDVKEVITVGFDALPEALKLIEEGILDATIEQFPGKQAATAFEILVKYLREGVAPEKPLVYIEPKVVTKDNLNEAEKSF